jgi:hypothetical protein
MNNGRLSTSIDIVGAASKIEGLADASFNDSNEANPKSANTLTTRMTNWLQDDSAVRDVYTPWEIQWNRGDVVPNNWRSVPLLQRSTNGAYNHRHHLHFNID